MEIYDLLKSIRGKDSLREASKKTGLSHAYINILEKGFDPRSGSPINPSVDTLKAYVQGYNYPFDELMKVAGYTEGNETQTKRENAEKLLEYLELELTNEEIKEQMTFKVDNLTLSDEEVDEFISFIRWQRSKKKQQAAASKSDEL